VKNHEDTANFYSAFANGAPIPGSRTGAAPGQVEAVIESVIRGRREKRAVTAESIAAESGVGVKITGAVFDALHL
jgi:hypothetical protein